jgi:energy-coupling factor transporter ATP-binding protein EcfA2
MQLTSFEVKGLFNTYNYAIPLQGPNGLQQPLMPDETVGPSVVILYGPNGSGKTTILAMINGFMELDFNIFRAVPFSSAVLRFSDGERVEVTARKSDGPSPLVVSYKDHKVRLHPLRPGPLEEKDATRVEEFRSAFNRSTSGINYTLIDTHRFLDNYRADDFASRIRHRYGLPDDDLARHQATVRRLAIDSPTIRRRRSEEEHEGRLLAQKVKRFINLAQGDYRSFFAAREPELFTRIIQRFVSPQRITVNPDDLYARLSMIREADQANLRLGIRPDIWDFDELGKILADPDTSREALAVIGAYVDFLESRHADRQLIAERLLVFERLINQFFEGITTTIDPDLGLRIESAGESILFEDQLSSGQYHLLYLLVEALTTRRRGTVIAIDEPELSMHISWQRKLIKALIECAAGAEPQFIFATHSPDLAANFRESTISLGESESK